MLLCLFLCLAVSSSSSTSLILATLSTFYWHFIGADNHWVLYYHHNNKDFFFIFAFSMPCPFDPVLFLFFISNSYRPEDIVSDHNGIKIIPISSCSFALFDLLALSFRCVNKNYLRFFLIWCTEKNKNRNYQKNVISLISLALPPLLLLFKIEPLILCGAHLPYTNDSFDEAYGILIYSTAWVVSFDHSLIESRFMELLVGNL